MDSIYYSHLRQYFNDTIKTIQKVEKKETLLQERTETNATFDDSVLTTGVRE
jgi:hypothetical protein